MGRNNEEDKSVLHIYHRHAAACGGRGLEGESSLKEPAYMWPSGHRPVQFDEIESMDAGLKACLCKNCMEDVEKMEDAERDELLK